MSDFDEKHSKPPISSSKDKSKEPIDVKTEERILKEHTAGFDQMTTVGKWSKIRIGEFKDKFYFVFERRIELHGLRTMLIELLPMVHKYLIKIEQEEAPENINTLHIIIYNEFLQLLMSPKVEKSKIRKKWTQSH